MWLTGYLFGACLNLSKSTERGEVLLPAFYQRLWQAMCVYKSIISFNLKNKHGLNSKNN